MQLRANRSFRATMAKAPARSFRICASVRLSDSVANDATLLRTSGKVTAEAATERPVAAEVLAAAAASGALAVPAVAAKPVVAGSVAAEGLAAAKGRSAIT